MLLRHTEALQKFHLAFMQLDLQQEHESLCFAINIFTGFSHQDDNTQSALIFQIINWTSARLTTWSLAFSARAALGPMIIISTTSIFPSASCNLKPTLSNFLSTAAWIASRFSIMSANHLASPALLDKPNPWLLTARSCKQSSLTPPARRKFEREIPAPQHVQSGSLFPSSYYYRKQTVTNIPSPRSPPPAPRSCTPLQYISQPVKGPHRFFCSWAR